MILTSRLTFLFFIVGIVSLLIFTIPSNFEMGSDYFDSHQYEKAFKYFSKTLKSDDSNVANLRRLKDYYLVKGEVERAMVLQEKLVKLRPANVKYWKDMENLYDWNLMPYEKLKAEEREAELVASSQAKPLLLEVAEGFRWLKKYDDANRVYAKLLKYDDPAVLDMALSYYTSTGQLEPAQKLLIQLSSKRKSDIYSRWLAEIAEADGKYLEANDYYRQGISILLRKDFSEDRLSDLSVGEVEQAMPYIMRLNQNYRRLHLTEKSEALNQQLLKSLDYNTALSYDQAYLQLENKLQNEAFESFKKLESREKDPERVLGICSIFGSLNHQTESLRCLEALNKRYPSNTRYLEALADQYTLLGDRKAALKVYEKILRIRGTREDASLWKKYRYYLIADATNDGSMLPKLRLSPKTITPLDEIKNDIIREKMLVLHNDLGEVKKSEKVLRSLLKRHPRNVEYLKQLGWILLNDKRTLEGYEVFNQVLIIDPNDKDALTVNAEEDYLKSNIQGAYSKIRKLPVGTRLAEIEFREEVYFTSGHLNEHRELCLQQSSNFPEIEIRCLYRLGKFDLATSKAEKLLFRQPDHIIRSTLVGWYIEQEDLEKAEYHHQWLINKRKANDDDKIQSVQIEELRQLLKQRTAWVIRTSSQQVIMKKYQYNLSSIEVQKRLNGPGIGVNIEHLDTIKPFTLITPYISYLNQHGEVSIGPTLSEGSKHIKSPFTATASYFGSRYFFASLRYENSRPEYQLKELLQENKAYKQMTSLYVNYTKPENYQIESSVTANRYTFDAQNGDDWQTFTEFMKSDVFHKRIALGARFFTAHLNSQDLAIQALHIQDALAYYAIIQYSNSFIENSHNQWNYLAKLALGGDHERNISFGKAYNLRLQSEYLLDDQKGVRFYGEYYKESYLALVSSMQIFGINIFTYF